MKFRDFPRSAKILIFVLVIIGLLACASFVGFSYIMLQADNKPFESAPTAAPTVAPTPEWSTADDYLPTQENLVLNQGWIGVWDVTFPNGETVGMHLLYTVDTNFPDGIYHAEYGETYSLALTPLEWESDSQGRAVVCWPDDCFSTAVFFEDSGTADLEDDSFWMANVDVIGVR